MNCRWLLALSLFAAANVSAAGRYFEVAYAPSAEKGELQIGVTYKLWIPDGAAKLRGVIVHQHGCGAPACRAGATASEDLHWQALAKKLDMALLGPSYQQAESQDCALWSNPRNGSDKTFLKALSDLAAKSNHPEVATVPWALWGHSGGGSWSGGMQALHPERIAAIWFRSGTVVPTAETPEAAYGIPMMCNTGVKERDHERFHVAWDRCLAAFKAYRAKQAPIAFVPDPRTSHECGDSRYLAIPFFDAVLPMRLPPKSSKDQALRPVEMKGAYLAPLLGDKAVPAAQYSGKLEESVWLPDRRVAEAWAEYVKTGSVSDSTPPPSPTNLKTTRTGETVEITWSAAADFESGIAGFVIERDGQEIAKLPADPKARYGRPLFQNMSYHDTPEAPVPELRFLDTAAKRGAKYRVIAINSVNLRSTPSKESSAR
jgi:hypothetical protein